MPLSVGDKLGSYTIVAPIGAGGMAEVYRARDSKLEREVAIKVLPLEFASDDARLARSEREAKVLALLNHPNIAQIYGIEDSGGARALVMELVPGETLRQRMETGPVSIPAALSYARQIIGALESAHDKGIVHRDLKPANIMITPEGLVKVLDFGLALIVQPASRGDRDSTMTMSATRAGMVLGTAGYMSPEDRRADIWAFGIVMWEMLTGKRLFDGDSLQDITAAVLTREPAWEQVPARFRKLLRSCLQKDVQRRLRDIGDAGLLLEEDEGSPAPPASLRGRDWWRWLATGAVLASIGTVFALWQLTRPQERLPIRFEVELGTDLVPKGRASISPDGTRIAFVGQDGNHIASLLTRRLDQGRATVLDGNLGSGGQDHPVFSPDSKWIGYGGDHKLKKVSVDGGLPVVLAPGMVADGNSAWADNGEIISLLSYSGLSRVSAAGGGAQPMSKTIGSYLPSFLPGGKTLILSGDDLSIMPLDGKISPIPGIRASWAQYISIGYILYLDERSTLEALPFDAKNLKMAGRPIPLLEDIESFDISSTGTLLCRRGKPDTRTIQWVDESGKTTPIIDTPGPYGAPQFSPDGKRLALTMGAEDSRQIWIYDLEHRALNRLTFEDAGGSHPLWMPGGKFLLFRRRDGLYSISSDGGAKPRRVLETDGYPESISPDGRTVAIVRATAPTGRDIWLAPLHGEGDTLQAGAPQPFINGPADELNPAFSPDGKWMAYASNQTGAYTIYVRSLKRGSAAWQISTEEGFLPQWSHHRPEIIFRPLRSFGRWTATYTVAADVLVPGVVRPFAGAVEFLNGRANPDYAVPPSGDSVAAFVVTTGMQGAEARPNYILILNFFEEIKRRAAQAQ